MKTLKWVGVLVVLSVINVLAIQPPSNLAASSGLINRIELTWPGVSGATGYIIYKGSVNNTSEASVLNAFGAWPGATNFVYNDMRWTNSDYDSSPYYYWVKSTSTSEISDWGNCVTGRFDSPTSTDASYPPESVLADYDGDKLTDPSIYTPTKGIWSIRLSSTGYATYTLTNFGGTNYTAVVADFDGDGISDPTVFCATDRSWKTMLSRLGWEVFEIKQER